MKRVSSCLKKKDNKNPKKSQIHKKKGSGPLRLIHLKSGRGEFVYLSQNPLQSGLLVDVERTQVREGEEGPHQ